MSNLRMKYQRKELRSYFEDGLLLDVVRPSLKARHPRILSKYRFQSYPQWEVCLRCSVSSGAAFRWLCAKKLIGYQMSYGENLVLFSLVSDSETRFDTYLEIVRFLKSESSLLFQRRSRVAEQMDLLHSLDRMLHGTSVSVYGSKEWKPQEIPLLRRIGVGYKDKGTLGTGLSWKEQYVSEEDPEPQIEWFQSLVYSLTGKT